MDKLFEPLTIKSVKTKNRICMPPCVCFGLSDEEMKKFLTDDCMLYLDNGPDFGEAGSGWQRFNIACPRKILEDALDRLYKGAIARGLCSSI